MASAPYIAGRAGPLATVSRRPDWRRAAWRRAWRTLEAAPLAARPRIPAIAHLFIPQMSRTIWFGAVLDRAGQGGA